MSDEPFSETKNRMKDFIEKSSKLKVHPAWASGRLAEAVTKAVVGDILPDNTVYVGVSPNMGNHLIAAPEDAILNEKALMLFHDAQQYASSLDAYGHTDWRLPREAELNLLYAHRRAIGNFNETKDFRSTYWSSTPDEKGHIYVLRFLDGLLFGQEQSLRCSLRCVRSIPK